MATPQIDVSSGSAVFSRDIDDIHREMITEFSKNAGVIVHLLNELCKQASLPTTGAGGKQNKEALSALSSLSDNFKKALEEVAEIQATHVIEKGVPFTMEELEAQEAAKIKELEKLEAQALADLEVKNDA